MTVDPAVAKAAILVVENILLMQLIVKGKCIWTRVAYRTHVLGSQLTSSVPRHGFVRQDRLSMHQYSLCKLIQKGITPIRRPDTFVGKVQRTEQLSLLVYQDELWMHGCIVLWCKGVECRPRKRWWRLGVL